MPSKEAVMLEAGDFYYENGLLVFTEAYHRKRGYCCGNACRHCPYDHANVPAASATPSGERIENEAP